MLLAPLMIVVKSFSTYRPASLAIRHTAICLPIIFCSAYLTDLTKLFIPVIFYLLGTFVSLVQALVFTLLSMVYVGLAISHDH